MTAAMGTLEEMTAFARARLDEDEAAAEANIGAGPGWQHGVGDHEGGEPIWPDYQTHESDDLAAAERYLERFRPLRMLRDVAAKRAILDLCRTETDGTGGRPLALRVVQHMVTEWDDHPDYKAGWKP